MRVLKKIVCILSLIIIFVMHIYIFTYNIYNSMYNKSFNIDYSSYFIKENNNNLSSDTLNLMVNDIVSKTIKDIVYNKNSVTDEYVSLLLDQNMNKITNELTKNLEKNIDITGIDIIKQTIRNSTLTELINIRDEAKKAIPSEIFEIISKIFSQRMYSYVSVGLILLIILSVILSEKLKGIRGNGIVAIVSSIIFVLAVNILLKLILNNLGNDLSFVSSIFQEINNINISYCKQFFIFGIIMILLYIVISKIIKNKEA